MCIQTSRKWLTVAIFRKWQDSSVALWIKIAVIQRTSEFIHEEISIMDYNGLSWTIMEGGGGCHDWHGWWDFIITIMDYHELSIIEGGNHNWHGSNSNYSNIQIVGFWIMVFNSVFGQILMTKYYSNIQIIVS